MGRHQYRRTYRRPLRNTNVISLRDHPAQLEQHWERTVVPELVRNSQYYKAMLATKPSITTILEIWRQQRDDFDLLTRGTSDPDLYERRKLSLDAAEARMAALVDRIEAHNAEVRRRAN